MFDKLFGGIFKGKKVLITGHTGFKGSWLSLLLHKLDADVYGYALEPPTNPSLFQEARISELITSYIGDIRDYNYLFKVIQKIQPEIIIHMAAQPLVRESYKNPIETYAINIMGTVNLFEAIRQTPGKKVIINVTTDKCYENREWHWGYRENEAMGGYDPYSNSKGCSELVTSSFRKSYFNPKDYKIHGIALASARAGNVIGGGDWAADRLLPDFIKAISANKKLRIRNPFAIRPWQHVMEPLNGYLMLAQHLITNGTKYAQAWNFGPENSDVQNVKWITEAICRLWGDGATFEIDSNPQPHEANYLKLDCSKSNTELGWHPKWDIQLALQSIINWNKLWLNGDDMRSVTENQISEYYQSQTE